MTSEQSSSLRSHPSMRRIGLVLMALALVYVAVGTLLVPRLIESQLAGLVEDRTGVRPTIEDVDFDPFAWRVTIEGFEMADPDSGRSLIAFEVFSANLRVWGLWKADVPLSELVLVAPRIAAEVDEEGAIDLLDLFQSAAVASSDSEQVDPDPDEAEASSLIVDIDRIRIERGQVSFRDRRKAPVFEVALQPFDLELTGLSTRLGRSAPGSLSIRMGEQTELHWEGSISLDPIASAGELELRDFDLGLPARYLADRVGVDVASGRFDAEMHYSLDFGDELELAIDDGYLHVSDFDLIDRALGEQAIGLPRLEVGPVQAKIDGSGLRSLRVVEISGERGQLAAQLDEQRQLSWVTMWSPPSRESSAVSDASGAEPSGPALSGEPTPEILAARRRRGEEKAAAVADQLTRAPEIRVDRFKLEDFTIDLEDRSTGRPVTQHLAPFTLSLVDAATTPGTTMQVALDTGVGKAGHLAIQGPVQIEPFQATLACRADAIALGDFDTYLEAYLQAYLRVAAARGSLSTELDLELARRAGGAAASASSGGELDVKVQGRAQIDDLLLEDVREGKAFTTSRRIRAEGIDLAIGPHPGQLRLEEFALAGTTARIEIDREGRSNLASIFGQSDPAATRESKAPPDGDAGGAGADPGFEIGIARVRLDDLGLDFVDLSIDPKLETGFEALSGTIDGLSSDAASRAKVDLQGRFRGGGPIEIEGEMNPLSSDIFADLRLSGAGLSLAPFSGYSGRFVGYGIAQGSLGLDLEYELANRRLDAQHHFHLHRFRFGDKVQSEQATKLPVTLAAAVMRDPKGNIELDLPIRGNLDDPSFSVLGLLSKTFVSVVTNAATSPFAVVGGLVVGSGGGLAQVVFDPGSARITPSELPVISSLAAALVEQPGFRLEVLGRAASDLDGPALQAARLESDLRRIAFEAMPAEERARWDGAESIQMKPAERRRILEQLYRERIGDSEVAPSPEGQGSVDPKQRARERMDAMAQALSEQIVLDDAEYRALADARARAVEQAFLGSAELDPSHVHRLDVEVTPVAEGGVVAADLSLAKRAEEDEG